MKSIQIMITRFLLVFYLSSSYLSATHIHHDTLEVHGDCKVCIVVKNLNSGDVPNTQPNNLTCIYCYEPIAIKIAKVKRSILKGFNANAPPLS